MSMQKVYATVPNLINFQGKVVNADGTNVANGSYNFDFVMYDDPTLGTPSDGVHDKWHELSKSVTVTNGVFQTNLGSATTLPDFNANPSLYLAIKFNADAAGYMTPRIQLTSVPYALNSDKLGGLASSAFGQLTANQTWTGANIIQPSSSTTALQIQNSSSARLFNVDTSTTANLITNGDFESDGVTGWTVKGSTSPLTAVTTQQEQGNSSLSVATTTAANDGAKYVYNLSTATTYTLSFYARTASGVLADVNAGRQEVTGTDKDISVANGDASECTALPVSAFWQRFTCTFTTGGTITSSNIYIKKTGTSAETFYVDGVQLETGASTTGFNPGGVLQLLGIINSPVVIQGKDDSPTAFQVRGATTGTVFSVDTANDEVGIGGGSLPNTELYVVSNNDTTLRVKKTSAGGQANVLEVANNVAGGTNLFTVSKTGSVTALTTTNSATALTVQNSSSQPILTVDTSSSQVLLGKIGASGVDGKLTFNNATNSNTVSFVSGATAGSYSLTLPTTGPSTSQCLQSDSVTASQLKFSSCGSGSGLAKNSADTSSAAITSSNNLYVFTNSSSAVASGVLKLDNGTNTNSALTVTASGNPTSGQALIFASNTNASPTGNLIDLQSGSSPTSKFSVDASGNVTALGNITLSGTSPVSIQGTASNGTLNVNANGSGSLVLNTTGAGTVSLGTTNSTTVGIGSTSSTLTLESTSGATAIQIGNGATAHGIQIGTNATGDNDISIGGANTGSTFILEAGTAASAIQIGNGNTAHGIQIGTNSGSAQTVVVGSTNASSALTLQAGTSGVLVKPAASATALQVQNSSAAAILTVNTSGGNAGNLVANPSFETTISGSGAGVWVIKQGGAGTPTIANNTSQFFNQLNSAKVVTTANAGDGIKQQLNTTLTGNTPYNVVFYSKLDIGSVAMSSDLQAGYSSTGASDDTACALNQSTTATGWIKYSCTFTTPASPNSSNYFYIKQTDGVVHTFYVDAVLLQLSSTADANYRDAQLSVNGIFNSPLLVQNSVNSTNALTVQNAAGGQIFNVDTTDTNLLNNPANPSFEVNTTGWAVRFGGGTTTATINRDTSQQKFGIASLKITSAAQSGDGTRYTLASGNWATGNTTVSFSLLNQGTAFAAVPIVLFGNGSDNACGAVTPSTIPSTSGWTRYAAVCNFSGSTNSIVIAQNEATAHTFYIDAVQIETGSTATVYGLGAISISGQIITPTVFKNQSNSAAAFQVQNTNGDPLIGLDTTNTILNLGETGSVATASTVNIANSTGAATQTINIGATNSANNAVLIQGGTGASAIGLQVGASGTISVGTTVQTSTLNLGNTSASTTTLINGGTGASAISLQAGTNGTISLGTTNANTISIGATGSTANATTVNIANSTGAVIQTVNIGSLTSTSATLIQGGTGASAIGLQVGASGTIKVGTTVQTTTLNIGNTSASTVTTINGGTGAGAIALTPGVNGGVSIGAATGTGTIVVGQSTGGETINIGNVATGAGVTHTISIGATNNASTGITTIAIGNSNTSTGANTVTIKAGSSARSTGPSVTLGNVATQSNAVCSSLTNNTAPTAGTAYELYDCNVAPAIDYAEFYPTDGSSTYGDILTLGSQSVQEYDTDGQGNILYNAPKRTVSKLVKATQAYASNVVGVVSNNYDQFTSTGLGIVSQSDNPMPIALNGRIPVNISPSSDPIAPGDYITTSSDPGKGAKATRAGEVIGKALEAWNPSSGQTQIMVFVEQGYYAGSDASSMVQNGSDASLTNLSVGGNTTLANLSVTGPTDLSRLNVSGPTTLNSLTVTGDENVGGTLTVASNVNIGGSLTVAGTVRVANLQVDNQVNLGSANEDPTQESAHPITKRFKASKPILVGSVVIADVTPGYATTTALAGDTRVVGVAVTGATNTGDIIEVAIGGTAKVSVNGSPAIGQLVHSDKTEGKASVVTKPMPGEVLGKVLSTVDQNGEAMVLVTLE